MVFVFCAGMFYTLALFYKQSNKLELELICYVMIIISMLFIGLNNK